MRAPLDSAFHKNLKSIPIVFDVDIFFNERVVLTTLQRYTFYGDDATFERDFNTTFLAGDPY